MQTLADLVARRESDMLVREGGGDGDGGGGVGVGGNARSNIHFLIHDDRQRQQRRRRAAMEHSRPRPTSTTTGPPWLAMTVWPPFSHARAKSFLMVNAIKSVYCGKLRDLRDRAEIITEIDMSYRYAIVPQLPLFLQHGERGGTYCG